MPRAPLQFDVPIRLEMMDLAQVRLTRGSPLVLILQWRATGGVDRDYRIVVKILASDGKTVAE